MRGVLGELIVEGIDTNLDFLYEIMNDRILLRKDKHRIHRKLLRRD